MFEGHQTHKRRPTEERSRHRSTLEAVGVWTSLLLRRNPLPVGCSNPVLGAEILWRGKLLPVTVQYAIVT